MTTVIQIITMAVLQTAYQLKPTIFVPEEVILQWIHVQRDPQGIKLIHIHEMLYVWTNIRSQKKSVMTAILLMEMDALLAVLLKIIMCEQAED